jgi:hypothetical protein
MRARKPCVRFRRRLLGWYVRFIRSPQRRDKPPWGPAIHTRSPPICHSSRRDPTLKPQATPRVNFRSGGLSLRWSQRAALPSTSRHTPWRSGQCTVPDEHAPYGSPRRCSSYSVVWGARLYATAGSAGSNILLRALPCRSWTPYMYPYLPSPFPSCVLAACRTLKPEATQRGAVPPNRRWPQALAPKLRLGLPAHEIPHSLTGRLVFQHHQPDLLGNRHFHPDTPSQRIDTDAVSNPLGHHPG